jgi:hypothetical protein
MKSVKLDISQKDVEEAEARSAVKAMAMAKRQWLAEARRKLKLAPLL